MFFFCYRKKVSIPIIKYLSCLYFPLRVFIWNREKNLTRFDWSLQNLCNIKNRAREREENPDRRISFNYPKRSDFSNGITYFRRILKMRSSINSYVQNTTSSMVGVYRICMRIECVYDIELTEHLVFCSRHKHSCLRSQRARLITFFSSLIVVVDFFFFRFVFFSVVSCAHFFLFSSLLFLSIPKYV